MGKVVTAPKSRREQDAEALAELKAVAKEMGAPLMGETAGLARGLTSRTAPQSAKAVSDAKGKAAKALAAAAPKAKAAAVKAAAKAPAKAKAAPAPKAEKAKAPAPKAPAPKAEKAKAAPKAKATTGGTTAKRSLKVTLVVKPEDSGVKAGRLAKLQTMWARKPKTVADILGTAVTDSAGKSHVIDMGSINGMVRRGHITLG